MGQALGGGGVAVMCLGRRHDDVEPEPAAQEGGDPPGPSTAHRAERDLQPADAAPRALRTEERVGGDDRDVTRQAGTHRVRGGHFHRADVEHEGARRQVRADLGHDRRDRRDRNRQDDDGTAGGLAQGRPRDVVDRYRGYGRIVGLDREMRRQMVGDEAAEGPKADQAEGRTEVCGECGRHGRNLG